MWRQTIKKWAERAGDNIKRFRASIATFINSENHERWRFSTVEKWNPSSTSAESIRVYVRTFWNWWFDRLLTKMMPQTRLDQTSLQGHVAARLGGLPVGACQGASCLILSAFLSSLLISCPPCDYASKPSKHQKKPDLGSKGSGAHF